MVDEINADGTTWTDITVNGTSSTYNVPTTAAGNTFYRVHVTDLANNCNDPYSNSVEIDINEAATVSVAATNEIVCIGGSSVINSTITNGSGLYLYQWQSSPDGSTWTNISSGGTSASYTVPTNLEGTTHYRLMLTDLANGCGDPVSNAVTVTVVGQVTVSVAVDNPIVCIGGSALISISTEFE